MEHDQVQHKQYEQTAEQAGDVTEDDLDVFQDEPQREEGQERKQRELEPDVGVEVHLVSFPDAVTDPWTVVVER